MRTPVDCPDVIIPNGSTASNVVLVDSVHGDADDVVLMANTIDGTHTYLLQINDKRDGTGNWYTLNDGTADIVPPSTVFKASVFPFLNHTFRILANGAVVGGVIWKMKKTYSVGTGVNNS
jgi:hypothetical protein